MMASFITERDDEPWDSIATTRATLGRGPTRDDGNRLVRVAGHRLEARDSVERRLLAALNLHATPIERQMMLYSIEQSLMPGETGKRYEYETAVDVRRRALSALSRLRLGRRGFARADRTPRAQSRRNQQRRSAVERAETVHAKTWAALDQYRPLAEQRNWWPDFVRRVLGNDNSG